MSENNLSKLDFLLDESDRLRDSLLGKLFSLNTLLSAVFLVIYQMNKIEDSSLRFFNVLPIITVLLIMLYEIMQFITIGRVFHENQQKKKENIQYLKNWMLGANYVICIAAILTIIELGYLVYVFLV
ncbi:hypothetical protein NBY09_17495 [Elizabethkingia anophelis]|uniref:hypothetical protein n=1 Tax=Elizabethkingia anophelis TaxID=1117645 RepID=UPI00234FC518|nr:hypothetical protein [Elizabethkingia anophelis]MDC8027932.1 hypothetical protein [Elizabethkingia anophelis]